MRIRELERQEWALFRELRPRALAESPSAFARRFVDEKAQPDAHWIRLTESVTMPGGQTMLLAEEDGRSFGLVFGLLDRERPTTGHVGGTPARGHRLGAPSPARAARAVGHRRQRPRPAPLRAERVHRHRKARHARRESEPPSHPDDPYSLRGDP